MPIRARRKPKQEDAKKRKWDVASRWTPRLVEGGFTVISDYFLENYARLEPPISAVEGMFIVHLMKFKWDQAHPFPKFALLAAQMGMKESGVRACARKLQGKGYLERRLRGGRSNEFDLTPLFAKLEELQGKENVAISLDEKTTAEAQDAGRPL